MFKFLLNRYNDPLYIKLFHTSRQPSRQPIEQPISARLSPVPESSPSQVPESIIIPDEANNLIPLAHQQGSPSNLNDSFDDDYSAPQHGQLYGANLANPPANLVNPPANLATPLVMRSSL